MKVGYAYICQNPMNQSTDYECHRAERRLAELAEPLGFHSIWGVEHHFTDYTMCPDVLQFLAYFAARTQKIELGSMVVVLPWHDPMRVAEEVALLDPCPTAASSSASAAALGRVEFEGFRVDMDESRERFVESARDDPRGLETGYCEYDGKFVKQPRERHPARARSSRSAAAPTPPRCHRSRRGSWPSSASASSSSRRSRGNGRRRARRVPRRIYREVNGTEAPAPIVGRLVVLRFRRGPRRGEGPSWISGYWETAMRHYEFARRAPGPRPRDTSTTRPWAARRARRRWTTSS